MGESCLYLSLCLGIFISKRKPYVALQLLVFVLPMSYVNLYDRNLHMCAVLLHWASSNFVTLVRIHFILASSRSPGSTVRQCRGCDRTRPPKTRSLQKLLCKQACQVSSANRSQCVQLHSLGRAVMQPNSLMTMSFSILLPPFSYDNYIFTCHSGQRH